jgi:hypothetical protein
MSLLINPAKVSRVLLADGWHDVKPGSFYLDSYEYGEMYENHGDVKFDMQFRGGVCSLVPSTGFSFDTGMGRVRGPITAILAVLEAVK